MRLWSLHPKYLDSKGLVALWRETLLAKHVLEGKTKGYRNHPQLDRFKLSEDPLAAINYYLQMIYEESNLEYKMPAEGGLSDKIYYGPRQIVYFFPFSVFVPPSFSRLVGIASFVPYSSSSKELRASLNLFTAIIVRTVRFSFLLACSNFRRVV